MYLSYCMVTWTFSDFCIWGGKELCDFVTLSKFVASTHFVNNCDGAKQAGEDQTHTKKNTIMDTVQCPLRILKACLPPFLEMGKKNSNLINRKRPCSPTLSSNISCLKQFFLFMLAPKQNDNIHGYVFIFYLGYLGQTSSPSCLILWQFFFLCCMGNFS